jgi:DNA-binding transcriptional LysR family regulator
LGQRRLQIVTDAVKLTISQLEALFWIARLGSARAAANRLNITQPALSLRIKELEIALGGRLLNRDSYRATLTTFGLEVAQQAERMLEIAEGISNRFVPINDMRGLIRMGATDTFAARFLPGLLVDIESNYPKAQIELVVEFSFNLHSKLLRGELDLAVISGPTLSPLLVFEHLMDLPHFWVGTPKRLGKIKIATPKALAKIPIVTHPHPSLLFETIHSWFSSVGLEPLRLNTCTSLFISKALTVEGVGLSLLPAEIIEPEIRAGTLRILKAQPAIPTFPMFIAYRLDTPTSNVKLLIDRIRASVVNQAKGVKT